MIYRNTNWLESNIHVKVASSCGTTSKTVSTFLIDQFGWTTTLTALVLINDRFGWQYKPCLSILIWIEKRPHLLNLFIWERFVPFLKLPVSWVIDAAVNPGQVHWPSRRAFLKEKKPQQVRTQWLQMALCIQDLKGLGTIGNYSK